MREVLILGYGNPLRGDDAFGWYMAGLLEEEYQNDDRVRVIPCHQLTPDLAETLSHFGTVVFIDASCDQTEEVVRCVQLEPEVTGCTFSHHINPSMLLTASEILYGWLPRAYMVSIVGQSFGLGEDMSPHVRSGIPDVLNRIREIVDSAWTGERVGLSSLEGRC
jgi:hydrogenase maturation protease